VYVYTKDLISLVLILLFKLSLGTIEIPTLSLAGENFSIIKSSTTSAKNKYGGEKFEKQFKLWKVGEESQCVPGLLFLNLIRVTPFSTRSSCSHSSFC
jgi:hypothetical protein